MKERWNYESTNREYYKPVPGLTRLAGKAGDFRSA